MLLIYTCSEKIIKEWVVYLVMSMAVTLFGMSIQHLVMNTMVIQFGMTMVHMAMITTHHPHGMSMEVV